MADDAATVEQLRAENARLREQHAAEVARLASENGVLRSQLADRDAILDSCQRALSEGNAREAATAEVLRVISNSPADLQPVMTALGERALTLLDASGVFIYLVEGDHLVRVAGFGALEHAEPNIVRPLDRTWLNGQALLDRQTIHVRDIAAVSEAAYPLSRAAQQRFGYRTGMSTPMLREEAAVGVIAALRMDVRPFSQQQTTLLETFAAQAVIAIENARLFEELERRNRDLNEALEQQTATADILRLVATSPTDVGPVIQGIVDAAVRLCGAQGGSVRRLVGDVFEGVVVSGDPFGSPDEPVMPFDGLSLIGRAVIEGRTIDTPDVGAVVDEYPRIEGRWKKGLRSQVAVPLLSSGRSIGVLTVRSCEAHAFGAAQIALLETFADQAVIAIENARLFEELERRNAELAESLEQQTATAEVLKIISHSAFDLEPVLTTLVENAARLCAAEQGVIFRFDSQVFRWAADFGVEAAFREYIQQNPVPSGRGSLAGRVELERRAVHILDATIEPDYGMSSYQHVGRYRTMLGVPMLRDGNLIGVFSLVRLQVDPFTEKQIELVTTFADQAVIAIENVRLFRETQDRVSELTALGEVSQAVSSSLDLQEVLTTVVSHAVELSGGDGGAVYELDADAGAFVLRAAYQMPEELIAAIQAAPPRNDDGSILARAARVRTAVQIADIAATGVEDRSRNPILDVLVQAGFRALLAMPLVHEDRVVGWLVVRRRTPGAFPDPVVNLVQTFANQSVLAIQNARLFQQVQETSRALEVASQHKSQFLANMSHELRTPLNAIIGYSEMLQEEAEDLGEAAFLPDLQRINSAGKHLLGLINDILDLSKIEAGRMDLFIQEFDVSQLVKDVGAIVQPLVEKNGNTLVVSCPDDVGSMQADLTKVRQSLFNLLSNAAKFTEHGTITLSVEREAAGDRDWLTFSVSDTGIGMTEEQLGRLFEAFSQAEVSTRSRFGGAGLGLAISRHFCRLMGGDLTVTSTYGQGSTFTVRLPAVVHAPVS